MENISNNFKTTKQRHGCVSAYLVFMIIVNSIIALIYLFANETISNELPNKTSQMLIILLGIIGLGNVVFAVFLLKWKKIGFYGFILTGISALIINISIGMGLGQSLFGLLGIALLYGILQIKNNNQSAWENLE